MITLSGCPSARRQAGLVEANVVVYTWAMSQNEVIQYWLVSAKEAQKTAEDSLVDKHYDWAFFLFHLTIEKLLKGLIVKQDKTPLPTHKLIQLAKTAGLSFTEDQRKYFFEITSYNIDARYDDYKRSFYKKVINKAYQKEWISICREIIIWLQNEY